MKLFDLIKNVDVVKTEGNTDIDISGIVIDGKLSYNGALFVCLKGNFDGHDYAGQAVSYGAKAIICEKDVENVKVTKIFVNDARKALSQVSAEFYGHPEKKLKIVGVTGTNGKTTTTYIIKKILDDALIKCGVIGTLGIFYDDVKKDPTLTTPDPLELFAVFADMVKRGVEVVVMEVSAHALYWEKVYGIFFEIGVFTNLTQDHLDFFGSMANYANAKTKLFNKSRCSYAVINSDDETGVKLINTLDKVVSYGIKNPADVFAINISESDNGANYVINLFDKIYSVKSCLMGLFNVYNSLAAATVCSLLGVNTDVVAKSLSDMNTVSGRMEKVYSGDFEVFIDYAHTPDGLKKCLVSLKKICKGRLICVFGCGGNRDEGKREKMGIISGETADFTVITSDNPRYEDPMKIIKSIEEGVLKKTKNYVIVEDRAEGIKYAVNYATKNDIILIAGKGSEKYQEILGIKRIYNDKDTVSEILS